MDKTKIDWCDSTWNPVTGCLHGCEYCYARSIANRFGAGWETASGNLPDLEKAIYGYRLGRDARVEPYPYNFTPTFHRYRLNDYIGKKGRNIFVCSMADLFGAWVPDEWIEEVFKACAKAPQHNYLFLTKYPFRLLQMKYTGTLPLKDNMWYGTSYTHNGMMYECDSRAGNWFLSIEPLLEDLGGMKWEKNRPGWVIIGAETGRRKDKVIPKHEWIENIVQQCRQYDIPVFMKSSLIDIWGESLIQEFPEALRRCSGE